MATLSGNLMSHSTSRLAPTWVGSLERTRDLSRSFSTRKRVTCSRSVSSSTFFLTRVLRARTLLRSRRRSLAATTLLLLYVALT